MNRNSFFAWLRFFPTDGKDAEKNRFSEAFFQAN